jgi:hypothetical protein
MTDRDIEKDEINKITENAQPRERAFFTIMRQSGLTPQAIRQLKIRDLEQNMPIPCKISLPPKPIQTEARKPPAFIGEEATKYIKQYLATRKDKTPECLLFTNYNDEHKEINTKDVSRTFSLIARKIDKTRNNYENTKEKVNKLRLFNLVKFYRKNAKSYTSQLKDNNSVKDDEDYRALYEEKALPYLEIEAPTAKQIQQLKQQHQKETQELKERLERIENIVFPKPPKTRIIKDPVAEAEKIQEWIEKHPEEAKLEEEMYQQEMEELEHIEKLMKEMPEKFAMYIKELHDKVQTLEYIFQSTTKKNLKPSAKS